MIVRVLGEGQFELDDDLIQDLNALDADLLRHVEEGREDGFAPVLARMIALIHERGRPLNDDELVPSSVILPPADASLTEIRELIHGEGLIPD